MEELSWCLPCYTLSYIANYNFYSTTNYTAAILPAIYTYKGINMFFSHAAEFTVLNYNVFLSTVLCTERDNSVAMTAPVLRCWQETRLGEALQTEHMTGARRRSRNPLEFLESPTGSTTSLVSTTAACGLTTVTTTSNIGPPVTAGVTSHPTQVSGSLTTGIVFHRVFVYCDVYIFYV